MTTALCQDEFCKETGSHCMSLLPSQVMSLAASFLITRPLTYHRKRRCDGKRPVCGLCASAGVDCNYPDKPSEVLYPYSYYPCRDRVLTHMIARRPGSLTQPPRPLLSAPMRSRTNLRPSSRMLQSNLLRCRVGLRRRMGYYHKQEKACRTRRRVVKHPKLSTLKMASTSQLVAQQIS